MNKEAIQHIIDDIVEEKVLLMFSELSRNINMCNGELSLLQEEELLQAKESIKDILTEVACSNLDKPEG